MIGHSYRPRTEAERREEFEERAAIGEYERGMSRVEAEREARRIVYGSEQLELGGRR